MENQLDAIKITQNTGDREIKALREQGRLHGHAHICFTHPDSIRSASNRQDYVAVQFPDERKPYLRILIEEGVSNGLRYAFTWEDKITEGDFVTAVGNVHILVNANSMIYLKNSELNYEETQEGIDFVIRNPNALDSCVCPTPNFCEN